MPELPYEIWKDRIENELKNIQKLNVLVENSVIRGNNSVEFTILINAFGLIKTENDLRPQMSHRIFLKINRSFPYPGGIDFSWFSNIFHPNIHPVENPSTNIGTGYICLNVLKKWSRLSDLETTIKALRTLVEHPNPDDPLNYPKCLQAAEFFNKKSVEDLKKKFKIEEESYEEKEKDDEILIIDD